MPFEGSQITRPPVTVKTPRPILPAKVAKGR